MRSILAADNPLTSVFHCFLVILCAPTAHRAAVNAAFPGFLALFLRNIDYFVDY